MEMWAKEGSLSTRSSLWQRDRRRAVLASLIPILLESGIGSDVMKPIAAPIVGEMITSTIYVLILTTGADGTVCGGPRSRFRSAGNPIYQLGILVGIH